MRLVVLFGLLTFFAIALQTAIPFWLSVRILLPNLIVILAVDLGLRHHGVIPAILAFAMGYATDAFSGTTLGVNAFLITIVFLMTYEIASRLLVTNAAVGAFMVFIGVLITTFGGVAIISGTGGLARSGPMISGIVIQALVSALVAPFVFGFLSITKRLIGLPVGPARE